MTEDLERIEAGELSSVHGGTTQEPPAALPGASTQTLTPAGSTANAKVTTVIQRSSYGACLDALRGAPISQIVSTCGTPSSPHPQP
jgi:hypothetical protein